LIFLNNQNHNQFKHLKEKNPKAWDILKYSSFCKPDTFVPIKFYREIFLLDLHDLLNEINYLEKELFMIEKNGQVRIEN